MKTNRLLAPFRSLQYLVLIAVLLVAEDVYGRAGLSLRGLAAGFFTPHYGEEAVLPPEVFQAVTLLRSHASTSCAAGGLLKSHPLFSQRLIESAYPLRLDPRAEWQVTTSPDAPPGCRPVDHVSLSYLYRCGGAHE